MTMTRVDIKRKARWISNVTFQATAMLGLKTPWHLVGVQPRQYSYQGSVLSGSDFKIQSTFKVLHPIDRDVDNIVSKNTKPPFIAFYRLTLTTTSWFHSKSSFETSATLLKAQLIPVSNAECSLAMGRQRKKRSGNHVFAKILARFQNILTSHWQLQTLFVDRDSRRAVESQRTWFVPPMRRKDRILVR